MSKSCFEHFNWFQLSSSETLKSFSCGSSHGGKRNNYLHHSTFQFLLLYECSPQEFSFVTVTVVYQIRLRMPKFLILGISDGTGHDVNPLRYLV